MITVHHLENSRSHRILWLLEEMGVEYEVQHYARDSKTSLAPIALTKLHPLGKSPLITDGDKTIAESGAIIEYLVDKFDNGNLRPVAGTPSALSYTYWLHYAEGTFGMLMMLSLMIKRIETAPMPFFAKPIAIGIAGKVRSAYLDANVRRNIEFMESSLSRSQWFCGDELTAADVQMSFAVDAAMARMTTREESPNLASFNARVKSRPAFQRALEVGGPYNLGGAAKK